MNAWWTEAVCAALKGDTGRLADMLRHNSLPDDVREFLAWWLTPRAIGRPPMPKKFKWLGDIARNPKMYDALMDLKLQRANWYAPERLSPLVWGKPYRFPYKEQLAKTAKRWGVSKNALETRDRRSGKR